MRGAVLSPLDIQLLYFGSVSFTAGSSKRPGENSCFPRRPFVARRPCRALGDGFATSCCPNPFSASWALYGAPRRVTRLRREWWGFARRPLVARHPCRALGTALQRRAAPHPLVRPVSRSEIHPHSGGERMNIGNEVTTLFSFCAKRKRKSSCDALGKVSLQNLQHLYNYLFPIYIQSPKEKNL